MITTSVTEGVSHKGTERVSRRAALELDYETLPPRQRLGGGLGLQFDDFAVHAGEAIVARIQIIDAL